MIYKSWTMQPNISMRLSSVPHECWCCIETFLGFLRIFNVKLCPWRGMAYHGGTHLLRVPFVVSFIFFGYIVETKLIREATLKGHISGSRRGVTILRYGLESPGSQLNLESVKRL